MLVANQGIRREAFVEPSTGSSTASSDISEAPSLKPDSSLSTPRPASLRTRDRRLVGDEVGAVLPGTCAGKPPVVKPLQGHRHGVGRLA